VSQETRKKLRDKNIGKKQNEETIEKRKISQQKTWKMNGGKDGSGHHKKVRIVELNIEFNSVKDCANHLGCDTSNVSSCLKGRQKTVRGFHVVYVV